MAEGVQDKGCPLNNLLSEGKLMRWLNSLMDQQDIAMVCLPRACLPPQRRPLSTAACSGSSYRQPAKRRNVCN